MSEQVPIFTYTCPHRVMGLDLSLSGTGVVVLDGEGKILLAKTIGYSLEENATEEQRLDRIINLAAGVKKFVEDLHPGIVAIEGHAFAAKFGGARLAELHGVVKVQVYFLMGKAPMVVAIKKARKVVLDDGAADKKKIEKIVRKLERAGVMGTEDLGDHNQRDAWVIAEYARRMNGTRDQYGSRVG